MRYVIADGQSAHWDHIFEGDGQEVTHECSFVYDTESEELHAMRICRDGEWGLPTRSEMADLEDSLTNANAEALDDPQDFDLRTSDELPDWAAEIPAATPGM